MAKDYYAILGVLPTATLDEIRSAYRTKAKQYHPDLFGTNSAPFLRIQEAYDVLSDSSGRRRYDRKIQETGIRTAPSDRNIPVEIHPRRTSVESLNISRGLLDLGRIFPQTSFRSYFPSFDEIFDSLWNDLDRPRETKSDQFRTLTMEVHVTPDQARRGGRIPVDIPVEGPCSKCNGSGELESFECWRCGGSGSSLNEFSLQVEYPPGIQDFYRVAIPLDRYGIPDVCPVLLFRISSDSDFAESFWNSVG